MYFDDSSLTRIARARFEEAADFGARWSKNRTVRRKVLPAAGAVLLVLFVLYATIFAPPRNFPVSTLVKIAEGRTLSSVAQELKEKRIIRSQLLFKIGAVVFGGDGVIAGSYFFPHSQHVLKVAARFARGDFEIEPARVTIPEGANSREIAQILDAQLLEFDEDLFLDMAVGKEGYLFPDTYFFLPGEEPEEVLERLEKNFEARIADLEDEIEAFDKPLPEVLAMASLLEEEAPHLEDRRIIAGILWKRIERGMPLQVDAVFPYIIGKNSFELTRDDLQTDSPYNTYTNKGLPPGPITNPGLDSILAAVTPTPTKYLYYLSDHDGNFHYSTTYEQHLQAKAKYLGT